MQPENEAELAKYPTNVRNTYLVSSQVFDYTSELGWPSGRHGDVFQWGDKAGFKTSHWKEDVSLTFLLVSLAKKYVVILTGAW